MNRYTDQFETVLPSEVRDRFKIPRASLPDPYRVNEADYPDPPKDKRWRILIPIFASVAVIVGSATLISQGQQKQAEPIVEFKTLDPASIPDPTPRPAHPIPARPTGNFDKTYMFETPPVAPNQISVRRAELAESESWRRVWLTMPYGESVQATFLGKLSRQDDLPLTGNHVGDAYFVGAQTFVWVAPNGGSGMWIDPQ